MRFIRCNYAVLTLVCLAAAGCKRDTAAAAPAACQRGADPWLFSSTLDERPRVLTLALRKDV